MNATRFVFDIPPASVAIPEYLRHQPVEVLIVPLDERERKSNNNSESWLSQFSGAWKGEHMVREDPGNYELREGMD